jgi:hypothetical protein
MRKQNSKNWSNLNFCIFSETFYHHILKLVLVTFFLAISRKLRKFPLRRISLEIFYDRNEVDAKNKIIKIQKKSEEADTKKTHHFKAVYF